MNRRLGGPHSWSGHFGEVDIDNKSNNYLEKTTIIHNVIRPQKTPKENKNKIIHYTSCSSFVIR
jgi:hypothetical protein